MTLGSKGHKRALLCIKISFLWIVNFVFISMSVWFTTKEWYYLYSDPIKRLFKLVIVNPKCHLQLMSLFFNNSFFIHTKKDSTLEKQWLFMIGWDNWILKSMNNFSYIEGKGGLIDIWCITQSATLFVSILLNLF